MHSLLKQINAQYKKQFRYCGFLSADIKRAQRYAQKAMDDKDVDGFVDVSSGIYDRLRFAVYLLNELIRLRQIVILVNSGRFAISDEGLITLQDDVSKVFRYMNE